MFKNYVIKKFDFITLILVIVIGVIGIILIGSATGIYLEDGSSAYRNRQILGFSSGLLLMILVSVFDYHWYRKLSIPMFVFNVAILAAVLVMGDSAKNATRWIEIGTYRLQPSEFSKILLILILSSYFYYFKDKINNIFVIMGSITITAATAGLIFLQPDLSTSVVIFILFIFMIYIANISYYYILGVTAVAVPSAYFLIQYIQLPTQKLLKAYQVNRILSLIKPEVVDKSLLYQTNYSVLAIGSGQAFGKGLYLGKVNYYKFLPESQTDFIFGVLGEEFGFVGTVILLALMLVLIARLIYIGMNSMDLMGKLIVAGVASLLAFQTFINVGVAAGILPNTGLTLPFVSYGISSLWADMIGVGICLNVSMQPQKPQSELNVSGVNRLRKEVVK